MLTVDEETQTFDYSIVEMFRNGTYPTYAGWETDKELERGASYFYRNFQSSEDVEALWDNIYEKNYEDLGLARTSYPAWVPAFDNFDGTE